MADKLGSFTRVIIIALVGDAVFFTLLLAVPPLKWISESTLTNATVHFAQTEDGHLRFEAHEPAIGQELPEYSTRMESASNQFFFPGRNRPQLSYLFLQVDLGMDFVECRPMGSCPNAEYFAGFCDAITRDPKSGFCGNGTMRFETVRVSDFLHTCDSMSGTLDVKGFGPECELECQLVEDSIVGNIGECLRMEGNRRLTLGEYRWTGEEFCTQ